MAGPSRSLIAAPNPCRNSACFSSIPPSPCALLKELPRTMVGRCTHPWHTVVAHFSCSYLNNLWAFPCQGYSPLLCLLERGLSSAFLLNWQILKNITEILLGDPEDHSVFLLAMWALLGCSPWSWEGAWSQGVLPKQSSLLATAWQGVSRENEGQMSKNSMFSLQSHSRPPDI